MARKGRKSTVKFVLHKELIFLVAGILAIIAATIILSIPSKSDKFLTEVNDAIYAYNTTNSTSYANLAEDHVYIDADLEDIEDAIKECGSGEYVYVLYGSINSTKIMQYLNTINTEAKNREVENVYWYSSSKVETAEDLESAEFIAEINKDQEVFNGSNEDLVAAGVEAVDLLVYPALYVYKDGKLVFNSVTVDEDGSYNWEIMIGHAFGL